MPPASSANSFPPPSNELIDAYKALPESLKQKMLKALNGLYPNGFRQFLDRAGLLRGQRLETVVRRGSDHIRKIIDSMMCERCGDSGNLYMATTAVLAKECADYRDKLEHLLVHVAVENRPPLLANATDRIGMPKDHPFAGLLAAAARDFHTQLFPFKPAPAEQTQETETALAPSTPASNQPAASAPTPVAQLQHPPPKPSCAELDYLAEVTRLQEEAQGLISDIKNASFALPFDLEHAQNTLSGIFQHGFVIRDGLARELALLGKTLPQWSTEDELSRAITLLNTARAESATINAARTRLKSIAEELRLIRSITHPHRKRREELMALRMKAVEQVDVAANSEKPVLLPGPIVATTWLEYAYSLRDDDLEALLNNLREIPLDALADLIVSTGIFSMLEIGNQPPENGPAAATAPIPPAPALVAAEPRAAATSSAVQLKDPVASEQIVPPPEATTLLVPSIEESQTSEPPAKVADFHVTETTPDPSGSAIVGKEERVETPTLTVVGTSLTESTYIETQEDESIGQHVAHDIDPSIATVAARMVLIDQPSLAGFFLSAVPNAPRELSPSVFHLLALTPHLTAGDSQAAYGVAEKFSEWNGETPKDPRLTLLLWSALAPAAVFSPQIQTIQFLKSLSFGEDLSAFRDTVRLIEELNRTPLSVLSRDIIRGANARPAWRARIADARARIAEFQSREAVSRKHFTQGTMVWHEYVTTGPVDLIVRQVSSAEPNVRIAEEALLKLEEGRVNRDLQSLFRTRQTNKAFIEAGALKGMLDRIANFRRTVLEWIDLLKSGGPEEDYYAQRINAFRTGFQRVRTLLDNQLMNFRHAPHDPLRTAAAHAANRTVQWLSILFLDEHRSIELLEDGLAAEVLGKPLLAIFDVDVDPDWKPTVSASKLADAIAAFNGTMPSWTEIAQARAHRGDILGAERAAAFSKDPATQAKVAQSKAEFERLCRAKVTSALSEIGAARVLGIADEESAAHTEAALVAIQSRLDSNNPTPPNYAALLKEAHERVLELQERKRLSSVSLLEEIQRSPKEIQPNIKQRLYDLANTGDLLTVRDYMARIDHGESLPDLDTNPTKVFDQFFPERVNSINSAFQEGDVALHDVAELARSGSIFGGDDFSKLSTDHRNQAVHLLQRWHEIKETRNTRDSLLTDVFTALGFNVIKVTDERGGEKRGSLLRCTPISGRSVCPIPRYGSEAKGVYRLIHVWGRTSEESVIQQVNELARPDEASIVLYYGRLDVEMRRDFARAARESHKSFLVIDDILIVHLAAQRLRLSSLFLCALPFSYEDPYVTSSGILPPELFYGRAEELTMVTSRQASFVFGGRQLGKSALLREVSRQSHDPNREHYCVMLDLLNRELIGREKSASEVWNCLEREFSKHNGFKNSAEAVGDVRKAGERFRRMMIAWLEGNASRRAIALLDEADKFFEDDARNDFAVARQLKSLVDDSCGRFRICFAGLHNVRRTTQQGNHPLAHMSAGINIGAFTKGRELTEAYALATVPLASLGFRYANPELPTRILALTNYYPGLIQFFCARLLRRVRSEAPVAPPYIITDRDIEAVYQDSDLRQEIRGKFLNTLVLDPRYEALAYLLAWYYHDDPKRSREGIEARQLQDRVSSISPEPFVNMGALEFEALLDEMVGLGVLRRVANSDRFALRNPNLLLLLGDEDQVFEEAHKVRSVSTEYVSEHFHAASASRDHLRHPLTVAQDSAIQSREHSIHLFIGSDATRLTEVPDFLAERQEDAFTPVPPQSLRTREGFTDFLAQERKKTTEGLRLIWVGSKVSWEHDWLRTALDFVASSRSMKVTWKIVFAANAQKAWVLTGTDIPSRVSVDTIKKWQADFIRTWLPTIHLGSDPKSIEGVQGVLSSWPALIMELGTRARAGMTLSQSLTDLDRTLQTPENGRLWLSRMGILAPDLPSGMMKILKNLALQNPILEADFEIYAEYLETPIELISRTVHWADWLGVFEHIEIGAWRVDHLAKRLILAYE